MDDELRLRMEEWAASLSPGDAAGLPQYREVQAAIRAGDWTRAEETIARTPFARTPEGQTVRALLADARGDRGVLGQMAREIDFAERPDVKLWSLRESGRSREAAALIRGAWEEFRDDEYVLREGLYSAWMESDWTLVITLTGALQGLCDLTASELGQRGWALEKRRRISEAAEAYMQAYRQEPNRWISERLARIVVESSDDELHAAIGRFGTEMEGERSDDPWMVLIAIEDHLNSGRKLRGLRLATEIVAREVVKTVGRVVRRLWSRQPDPNRSEQPPE